MENIEEKLEREVGERLKSIKSEVLPSRGLLVKIMEDVTKSGGFGYSYSRGETKGRASIREEVVNEIESIIMSWKTWVPVGVVAVLVLVFLTSKFSGTGAPVEALSLGQIEDEGALIDAFNPDEDLTDDSLALEEVDGTLGITAATAAGTAQDPLGSAAIQQESNGVGFDSGLDSFFSEESDVNSSLNNL